MYLLGAPRKRGNRIAYRYNQSTSTLQILIYVVYTFTSIAFLSIPSPLSDFAKRCSTLSTQRNATPTLRFWIPTLRFWIPTLRFWIPTLRFWIPTLRFWIATLRFWIPTLISDSHAAILSLYAAVLDSDAAPGPRRDC